MASCTLHETIKQIIYLLSNINDIVILYDFHFIKLI